MIEYHNAYPLSENIKEWLDSITSFSPDIEKVIVQNDIVSPSDFISDDEYSQYAGPDTNLELMFFIDNVNSWVNKFEELGFNNNCSSWINSCTNVGIACWVDGRILLLVTIQQDQLEFLKSSLIKLELMK